MTIAYDDANDELMFPPEVSCDVEDFDGAHWDSTMTKIHRPRRLQSGMVETLVSGNGLRMHMS